MNGKKVDVSVIIVNYKVAPLIVDCVNSIVEKTKKVSYEVIVIDNDSQDDSLSILSDHLGDKIKLIEAGDNLGFGRANNLGAHHASGDYLFLLNPDTVLINDAISILHKYIVNYQEVGVVGGNLYDETGANATPSFSRQFSSIAAEKRSSSYYGLLKNKINRKKNKGIMSEFNYSNQPISVGYIFGADMMLSRELFDRVNGFDDDFFMYGEEAELQWRITQLGYRIMNCPDARIIHLEGRSTSQENTFSERQFRMRMTGTMLYYAKTNGRKAVEEFCFYRKRRYQRQLLMAKLKNNQDLVASLQRRIELIDEIYLKNYQ